LTKCFINIIKFIFNQKKSNDGIDGPANSTIWGYGVVALSLLGILYITFSLGSKAAMESSSFQLIKMLFTSSFPVLFLIGLLIWLIIMNVSYRTRINKGQVSNDYYKISFVSSILIILQIIIILKYVRDKVGMSKLSGENNVLSKILNELSSQMATFGYTIGTINYLIAGILQIILEYFSTDG
jgi:hypothetical protein